MEATKLTEMELQALRVCIDTRCTVEEMIGDPGMVMAGLPEMCSELGWNKKQAAAVIGSLEAKGMGCSDGNMGNGHIFWPSEAGYRAAYEGL